MKKTANAQQIAAPRPADIQYNLNNESDDNVLIENNKLSSLNEKSMLAFKLMAAIKTAKSPKEIESYKWQIVSLFEHNIKKILAPYLGSSDYEDYHSIARMAFYVAIGKFDPEKGVPFYAFAAHCARNKLRDFHKALLGGGIVSPYKIDLFHELDRWESTHNIFDSRWTLEDANLYAEFHETSVEHVFSLVAEKYAFQNRVSLSDSPNETDSEGNSLEYADFIAAEGMSVVKFVTDCDYKDAMWEAVDLLSDLDCKVLFLRTGVYDGDEKSFREIAEETGLSEYKVTQIYRDVTIYLENTLEERGYTYDVICYE